MTRRRSTRRLSSRGRAGRTLVAVVRDPARHAWQRAVLDAAAAHDGAVVVDVGWPTRLPPGPPLRTRGMSPRLLGAAAQILAGL